MQRDRGFTLIELLVVISIIGMLSSVVLVSLAEARDKGRVGGGVIFSGYNYQDFGATSVLYFDFNQSNIANITNQGISAGSISSSSPTTIPGGPTGQGYSLYLDNAVTLNNRYVQYTFNPRITLAKYTVSIWIKPYTTNTTSNGSIAINALCSGCGATPPQGKMINLQFNNASQYNNGRAGGTAGGASDPFVAIYYGDYLSSEGVGDNAFPGANIRVNRWSQITYTYDGSNYKLYIDGHKVSTLAAAAGGIQYGGQIDTVRVGTYLDNSNPIPFNGEIDDVAIYQDSLTADRVQELYAEEIASHPKFALR